MKDKDKKPTDSEDDVVFEETAEAVADLPAKIKKLKDKLLACEEEKRGYLDGWQRAQADFVNFKKDQEKAQKEFVKFANSGLIEDLIPVLDSFEMAFANKEAWEKVDKNWRAGVEYIYSQLRTVLEGNSLTVINPKIGDAYNHAEQEAVESVPVDDSAQDHKIIEIVSKGYNLNGRVVRPAKVKVGEVRV